MYFFSDCCLLVGYGFYFTDLIALLRQATYATSINNMPTMCVYVFGRGSLSRLREPQGRMNIGVYALVGIKKDYVTPV